MRAAMLLVAFAACSGKPVEHRAAPPRVLAGSGPSIYDVALTITDAGGQRVGLDVDRGHPTLISMFYGSCPAACPALIDTIGRTLDRLPKDTRVLLVSFDPARDTPEHLRELARAHHLDARWTLAAATDDDARTLAAVLGIRYRAVAGGQFFHTSAILALDRDGRTLARMDGLGDTSGLIAALAE